MNLGASVPPGRPVTTPLAGKVALITGGTKNIGRATARAFAAAGADLVLTARNAPGLEDARSEIETLGKAES